MASSRGSSHPRDWTCVSCVSCVGRQFLYHQRHLGSPSITIRLQLTVMVAHFFRSLWDSLGPGTWGPLLECLPLGNISSSNRTQRNYKGLKITAHMRSWDKLWTIRYNPLPQTNRHFWGAESKSGALHMVPARGTSKPVGRPPKLPWAHPQIHPYPHPLKEPACPPQRVSKGSWSLFSLLIKSCLNS